MRSHRSKIAFIVPYPFVPPKNGGHKAAFGFADFLSRNCDLVCISTNNNAEEAPFKLIRLFEDRFIKYFSPRIGYRIAQVFRQLGIDYVILHQPFIGLLLFPFLKWRRMSFAVYVQNVEYQRFRSLGKWWWPVLFAIEWVIYRQAKRLYFISPEDRETATAIFGLGDQKCAVVPYGTYLQAMPKDKQQARATVLRILGIDENSKILLFFGPQSYLPNREAVIAIMEQIHPKLKQKADFRYSILICGGGLPSPIRERIDSPNYAEIRYLGFVQDIDLYIKAADLMLNPIMAGGGVKTKIIESIALGTTVISNRTGAVGVTSAVTQSKLIIAKEDDYEQFSEQIVRAVAQPNENTPNEFYRHYYWGNAMHEVVENFRS